MLTYDKIDITEGIDLHKTNKSKKCMFCHYWYYLNKNFSYGPFTCDGCYNIVQKSIDFKDIAIIYVKKTTYTVYFKDISKNKAKRIINMFDLIGKTGDIYYNKNNCSNNCNKKKKNKKSENKTTINANNNVNENENKNENENENVNDKCQ